MSRFLLGLRASLLLTSSTLSLPSLTSLTTSYRPVESSSTVRLLPSWSNTSWMMESYWRGWRSRSSRRSQTPWHSLPRILLAWLVVSVFLLSVSFTRICKLVRNWRSGGNTSFTVLEWTKSLASLAMVISAELQHGEDNLAHCFIDQQEISGRERVVSPAVPAGEFCSVQIPAKTN